MLTLKNMDNCLDGCPVVIDSEHIDDSNSGKYITVKLLEERGAFGACELIDVRPYNLDYGRK